MPVRVRRSPASTHRIATRRASGASSVVISTTIATSHMPCSCNACGPVNTVVSRCRPFTVRSTNELWPAISSSSSPVAAIASGRRTGSVRPRRSTEWQRGQRATAPGDSSGKDRNSPQSGHSRSRPGGAGLVASLIGATSLIGSASFTSNLRHVSTLPRPLATRRRLRGPGQAGIRRERADVAQR